MIARVLYGGGLRLMEGLRLRVKDIDLERLAITVRETKSNRDLLRVDVPSGDTYRTEFYGMAAIYSIKIVSEQIARAYGHVSHDIVAYDTPIVTREQHQAVVGRLEDEQYRLKSKVQELERRLTAVNALPAPREDEDSEDATGF